MIKIKYLQCSKNCKHLKCDGGFSFCNKAVPISDCKEPREIWLYKKIFIFTSNKMVGMTND